MKYDTFTNSSNYTKLNELIKRLGRLKRIEFISYKA